MPKLASSRWRALALGAVMVFVAALQFGSARAATRATGAVVLSDQFNGGGLDLSKWSYQIGGWPNYTQIYLPTMVKEDGDGLHLQSEQPWPTTVNLSGGIQSVQSFLYGQFNVVARLPNGVGLVPSAWLTATGGNGEIDIFEGFGDRPTNFQTTVHDWQSGHETPPQCVQVGWVTAGSICAQPKGLHLPINFTQGFHNWGMTWTPSGTSFTLDGVKYWSTKWSPDHPMQLILAVGVGDGWDGWPDGTDVWPTSMDVKSVTVSALPS
jgi:beta-glucanase (GH16 family)